MKFYVLLLILLIPLTSALQFSPTTLQFNLEQSQISCKNIYFQIESPTTIHDAWAQKPLDDWSISNFKTSSQDLDLELSYPTEINPKQSEIKVCLSGANSGNYKGALIFRQEEVGNSIVQFAIWLKVNITAEVEEQPQEETSNQDSKKPSSSSRGSTSGIIWTSNPLEQQNQNLQQINFEIPNEKIKLSNQNPKQAEIQILPITLVALAVVLIILLVFTLIKN